MLKWISKSGTFIQFTVFAALGAWLWIPAFVKPAGAVVTDDDGPLYTIIASFVQYVPEVSVGIALILVVMQAFVLFYIFQANGFFGRSNFIPAIIVLLSFSWNSSFQTLHALLPACVFIIIALNSILWMYGKQASYRQVFTASFAISLASLFYLPLVYLLILIWLTLVSYRISSWREYVITLIGFILPWIYYISGLFWNDNLESGLHKIAESLFNLVLPERLSMVNILWLSVSGFVMIITMTVVLNAVSDKLISMRRRSWVMFGYSVASLIVILLSGWPLLSANYLFVIPLSFFVTGSVSMLKRSFPYEVMAMTYFLLFIVMRYFALF